MEAVKVRNLKVKKTKDLINRKTTLENMIINISLILFLMFCLIPFIMLLSGSVSDNDLLSKSIKLFPQGFSFDAYKYLFLFPEDMIKSYVLSITVTAGGIVLNLLLCLLMAYPLSKVDFKGRKILSFLLYFTILFNAGIIATYIVIRQMLHLYDTVFILILYPMLAPGHVFFLRVFLQSMPTALYESARIDGASEYRVLFTIAVPIIAPGIATICFQYALMYWNDAMTAMLFTRMTPVALYIMRWQLYIEFLKYVGMGIAPGGGVIDSTTVIPEMTVRFAMGVMTTLPMLVFFSIFQKYMISGMTAGAVKG